MIATGAILLTIVGLNTWAEVITLYQMHPLSGTNSRRQAPI